VKNRCLGLERAPRPLAFLFGILRLQHRRRTAEHSAGGGASRDVFLVQAWTFFGFSVLVEENLTDAGHACLGGVRKDA